MREKKDRLGWLFMLLVLLPFTSCKESSKEEPASLKAPRIIQSEEILDNPITLAFSWEAVGNAAKYMYQLEEVSETGNKSVVSGDTGNLSINIESNAENELFYSKEYVFTLKAVSANGAMVSEAAEAKITTSGGPIVLSVENMTYRSALLKGMPQDNNMLYQFAQVPVEKYKEYATDSAFIEEYDFGYYKKLGAMHGIPWYSYMKESSKKRQV